MKIKEKVLKELGKGPRKFKELKNKLGGGKNIKKAVDELFFDGKILYKNGTYKLATAQKPKNFIVCSIVKLGANFGFAKPEDGSVDVFIPGKFLQGAMPGDIVKVSLFEHPRVAGSVEGEVIEIISEENVFTATIKSEFSRPVAVPDLCHKTPLIIKKSSLPQAFEGEKVVVEIERRSGSHNMHRAKIIMRFGSSDTAKNCANAILYSNNIKDKFPASVKLEAADFENAIIKESELQGRKDLRALPIFTIDGSDTKDIDDAVFAKKTNNGYELIVSIADVSHYVLPQSALDAQAMVRGTSVYFANRVVPMLPKELSNGICSLNPKVDRLAFSCIISLDENAQIKNYKFEKTVIHSHVQGVYSEINKILKGSKSKALLEKYAEVAMVLPVLNDIYKKRAKLRTQRGALDIESDEAKIIVDESGKCIDIVKRERGKSEQIIEELMLLANECAASLAKKLEMPFVYRVHDTMPLEKIATLKEALVKSGIEFKFTGETPTQKELAKILKKTKGTPQQRFVHTSILRSMAKAKYETIAKGHFGLALEDYAHFTSPIRRYPDLAIHRILSDYCKNGENYAMKHKGFAAAAATQGTECEIKAVVAQRDIEDCYKAEYMQNYIGKDFTGTISGVTSFGVYVELENTVEGLVRINDLSEKGLILTQGISLNDSLTGKSYRLGDEMKITVLAVDIAQGLIDFIPAK